MRTMMAYVAVLAFLSASAFGQDWWERPDWELVGTSTTDNTGSINYNQLHAAADYDYVYLRVTLQASFNPFTGGGSAIHVDMDHNIATGFDLNLGGTGVFGSEAMWSSVWVYHEQASGIWSGNALVNGQLAEGDFQPFNEATGTLYVRIPRAAYHGTLGAPVFGSPTDDKEIRIAVRTDEGVGDYVYGSYTIRALLPPYSELGINWSQADVLYSGAEIGTDGNPALNARYRTIYVTHDDTHLYFGLATAGEGGGDMTNNPYVRHIYIDSDMNPATGYNGGWMTHGYDHMIQYGGQEIAKSYAFTGATQTDYSWEEISNVVWSWWDSFIEIGVPLEDIGLSPGVVQSVRLTFQVVDNGNQVWAPGSEAMAKDFEVPGLMGWALILFGLVIAGALARKFHCCHARAQT